MIDRRHVKEKDVVQGRNEIIARTVTVPTTWGTEPFTNLDTKVYDVDDDHADVTGSVTTGSTSASGQVITTPKIHSLTIGRHYRVEVAFTANGNDLVAWFSIEAQR